MKKYIFAFLSLFIVNGLCVMSDSKNSHEGPCDLSALPPPSKYILLPTPEEFKPKQKEEITNTYNPLSFEETHIGRVALDVQKEIFSYFDAKELSGMRLVCKNFRDILPSVAKLKIDLHEKYFHEQKLPLLKFDPKVPIYKQLYEYETASAFLNCGFELRELKSIISWLNLIREYAIEEKFSDNLISVILHSLPKFGILQLVASFSRNRGEEIRSSLIFEDIAKPFAACKNVSIEQIETLAKISDKIWIRQGSESSNQYFFSKENLKNVLEHNKTGSAIFNKCRLLWSLAEKKNSYDTNNTAAIIETIFAGDYDPMKLCLESFDKIGVREIHFMSVEIKYIKNLEVIKNMISSHKKTKHD